MDQLQSGITRIKLSGEFDISQKDYLAEILRPAERTRSAIIDMSETTYVDSSALLCLIHLRQKLFARGGSVHLIHMSPAIRRIFTICELTKLFEISAA